MLKILTTVDGSEESRAVLSSVADIARAAQASVTLLTVVGPPSGVAGKPRGVTVVTPGGSVTSGSTMQFEAVLQPPEPRWAESKDQAIQRVEVDATEMLDACREPLTRAGLTVQTEVLMSPDPAKAIVDYAREHNFDLIAMSTHGRTGLREVVQGSVAAAVMRSGVAPVLMVRPQK
jgi:nucleotide-binding universal stress UspA family protein